MNNKDRTVTHAEMLAKALGVFSIVLGVAEMTAPKSLARNLGMRRKKDLIRSYGIREIATGAAILKSTNPAPWLWARVAGDGLDLATLAMGFKNKKSTRLNVGLAIASVVGVTVLDLLCARKLSSPKQAVRDYSDRSGFPNEKPTAEAGWPFHSQEPQPMQLLNRAGNT